MNNIRFNREGRRQDLRSEQVRQSLEDYRRKIRFKQVKFSIIVLTWQVAILVLSMLLLEYNGQLVPLDNHSDRELEHMARITTFIIVFISIFCGWPCLLHFMAGFAKTGVVLSSVTGCLVFQSSLIIRALTNLAVNGSKLHFSLHDLTEATLVTASFNIR